MVMMPLVLEEERMNRSVVCMHLHVEKGIIKPNCESFVLACGFVFAFLERLVFA